MPNLATVRPDFARCRVLRHSWEVLGETEAAGSKLIVLRCDCGTLRYDRWNTRTGERWGNASYIWPDGYRDREPGHDSDWWRKTYAEYLYSIGKVELEPLPDTRQRAKKRAV